MIVSDGGRPATGQSAAAQADRCPWPRPFPEDFSGCAAYQPAGFVVADSMNRTIGAEMTCRHLTVGSANNGHSSRFYPRCALGGDADRRRWLAGVRPERAAVMRALHEEFAEFSHDHRDRLFAAKVALLDGAGNAAARTELETAMAAYLAAARSFVEQRGARFADVGLPPEDLLRDVEQWADTWMRGVGVTSPDMEGAFLRAEPAANAAATRCASGTPHEGDVHLRGRPMRPAAAAAEAAALAATPALVLATGGLQVERVTPPPTLLVSGEIDASSSEALGRAVADELRQSAETHLDLHGVLFCDLGGVRAMISAARGAGGGRRVVVHGMPGHLRRAVHMSGLRDLQELVLADDEVQA